MDGWMDPTQKSSPARAPSGAKNASLSKKHDTLHDYNNDDVDNNENNKKDDNCTKMITMTTMTMMRT